MKEAPQQLSDRDLVIQQVGKRKLKKAEGIAEASEDAFLRWEIQDILPYPPVEKQAEIKSLAKLHGINEGERYLWPKRVWNIQTAWNEATIGDLAGRIRKRTRFYFPERDVAAEEGAKTIGIMLKRAATNNPENPWDNDDRDEYIIKAGIVAAKIGLTEQAAVAIEMLNDRRYEKGIIAAMIKDEKTAGKVVENLLDRHQPVKIGKARKAAEIGSLLGDRGIVIKAIGKIVHQKNYCSAAELALEFDETEIAGDLVAKMLSPEVHQYLSAGKIAFSLGDLTSFHVAIEGLIQDKKLKSALKLANLTGNKDTIKRIRTLLAEESKAIESKNN